MKIGLLESPFTQLQTAFAQAELAKIGEACEVVIFQNHLPEALLRGDVDAALRPLFELPTEQPEGLCITALSERFDAADWLLVRAESVDFQRVFKFREGSLLAGASDLQQALLREIRPDACFAENSGSRKDAKTQRLDFQLENLLAGQFDALLLPAAEAAWLGMDLTDFQVVKLNPREFPPLPGQGILAWQTLADDLPTRRILKKIHHPETSACTNVERTVLKNLGKEIALGCFCERDATGNFHAFAVAQIEGELRRARVSQSTNSGLAEKIIGQFV